jgi:hypothetical protein
MTALSKQFEFIINSGTFTATSVSIPSAASAPDGSFVFKSNPQKGDGYYGSSDGLHTVTYTVTPNFVGTLTSQATLATSPIENDWFNIVGSSVNYDQLVNPVASTTTNYVNFSGNFVWCRALVHRADIPVNGSVMFINYNH